LGFENALKRDGPSMQVMTASRIIASLTASLIKPNSSPIVVATMIRLNREVINNPIFRDLSTENLPNTKSKWCPNHPYRHRNKGI
jgi:hypothetical protein